MNLFALTVLSLSAMSGLFIALQVSRDYTRRVALWQEIEGLSLEALKKEFDHCIAEVLLFRSRRSGNRRQYRRAELALIKATVVRERVYLLTGKNPPKSYLRSRKQVLAVVAHFERLSRQSTAGSA